MFQKLTKYLSKTTPAYPLGVFRMVFGLLMVFSAVRFMALGWIEDHYTEPIFHFKYWGFEWFLAVRGTYLDDYGRLWSCFYDTHLV